MNVRKAHRWMGITLLLPFFGWSLTGFVFFLKPGYRAAYDMPTPTTYPLESIPELPALPDAGEIRLIRTVLGTHLLVRESGNWRHLRAETGQAWQPSPEELKALVADALTRHRERYGRVVDVEAQTVVTDTGVRIDVHWSTLSMSQKGADTRLINALYEIHYLRWTQIPALDRWLGPLGLVLVLAMAVTGTLLLRAPRPRA